MIRLKRPLTSTCVPRSMQAPGNSKVQVHKSNDEEQPGPSNRHISLESEKKGVDADEQPEHTGPVPGVRVNDDTEQQPEPTGIEPGVQANEKTRRDKMIRYLHDNRAELKLSDDLIARLSRTVMLGTVYVDVFWSRLVFVNGIPTEDSFEDAMGYIGHGELVNRPFTSFRNVLSGNDSHEKIKGFLEEWKLDNGGIVPLQMPVVSYLECLESEGCLIEWKRNREKLSGGRYKLINAIKAKITINSLINGDDLFKLIYDRFSPFIAKMTPITLKRMNTNGNWIQRWRRENYEPHGLDVCPEGVEIKGGYCVLMNGYEWKDGKAVKTEELPLSSISPPYSSSYIPPLKLSREKLYHTCNLCKHQIEAPHLLRHLYGVHLKEKRLIECPFCPYANSCDFANARRHLKKHHNVEWRDTDIISHVEEHRVVIDELYEKCFPDTRKMKMKKRYETDEDGVRSEEIVTNPPEPTDLESGVQENCGNGRSSSRMKDIVADGNGANTHRSRAVWKWCDNESRWHLYPTNVARKLEQARTAELSEIPISLGRKQYLVDLTKLNQSCIFSGAVYSVMRLPPTKPTSSTPKSWSSKLQKECHRGRPETEDDDDDGDLSAMNEENVTHPEHTGPEPGVQAQSLRVNSISASGASKKSKKILCIESEDEEENEEEVESRTPGMGTREASKTMHHPRREGHVYQYHLKQDRLFECPIAKCGYSSSFNLNSMKIHLVHKHKLGRNEIPVISHEWKYREEIEMLEKQCFPDWQRIDRTPELTGPAPGVRVQAPSVKSISESETSKKAKKRLFNDLEDEEDDDEEVKIIGEKKNDSTATAPMEKKKKFSLSDYGFRKPK